MRRCDKENGLMKVFEHADHSFDGGNYGTPVHYMKDGRWEGSTTA